MTRVYEQSAFALSGVPSRLLIRTPFDAYDGGSQDEPATQVDSSPLTVGLQSAPAVPAPLTAGLHSAPAVRAPMIRVGG